jgi:peroxiredoxin (alkyl hydroperoxide reductase subunit C)
VAFRGAFIIDREGNVRSQLVNDLPLGRNIDELIRLVEALQFTDEHGEVCPAGWNKGDKGMNASPDGVAAYLAENAQALEGTWLHTKKRALCPLFCALYLLRVQVPSDE